jgi:hypothetical protein
MSVDCQRRTKPPVPSKEQSKEQPNEQPRRPLPEKAALPDKPAGTLSKSLLFFA